MLKVMRYLEDTSLRPLTEREGVNQPVRRSRSRRQWRLDVEIHGGTNGECRKNQQSHEL